MNKELFQTTTPAMTTPAITTSPIENDYEWSVNTDDQETVTLISFKGEVQRTPRLDGTFAPISINIPYMLDDKIVTIIGPSCYQGKQNFDRVVFHSDIISIEGGAFADCPELKYIAFNTDSNLQYIKQDAFLNTDINNPIIPASVIKIEDGAFNTRMLKNVTFLGDCPVFTANAFNSQNSNNNLSQKIIISYFNNAIGFENNVSDSKFMYVANYRMRLPPTVETPNPDSSSTSILTYIIYILLFILFIVVGIFLYRRYIKKPESNSLGEGLGEENIAQ